MPMVKLNESSSHRKLRNEIVRLTPKHLASAANAVGSNASLASKRPPIAPTKLYL